MTPDNDEDALRESVRKFIGRKSVRWIKGNVWPAEHYAKGEWWDTKPVRFWRGDMVDRVCQEEAEAAIARIEAKKGGAR